MKTEDTNLDKNTNKESSDDMTLPTFKSIAHHASAFCHYECDDQANLHRAILYRVHFNILCLDDFSNWGKVVQEQREVYRELKRQHQECLISQEYLNDMAASQNGSSTHRDGLTPGASPPSDRIRRQLILKDMNRLFMNGVDNAHFQTNARRSLLQNVLCLWCSSQQSEGGYKQGKWSSVESCGDLW